MRWQEIWRMFPTSNPFNQGKKMNEQLAISEEKIRIRVEARDHAKEIMSLIEIDEETVEFREAFWLQIYASIPFPSNKDPGPPLDPRPVMTDDEVKRFENTTLQFGAYRLHTYANCPTEYLLWLNGKGEQLAAYLRSRIGQERQEES